MSSAPQPAAERWQLLKLIFQAAGDLSPTAQKQYLDSACAGDTALRAQAEALLEADRREQKKQTTSAGIFAAELFSTPLLPGCRIGAYEILHEIGRGGMSAVYAAARSDRQFQKIVAVKVVRPALHFEEILRRFQYERELLASLEHPNIARLLDAGVTDDNLPYLVMEYVEGLPIDGYAEYKKLSLPERIALFRSVCSAVQYAHQNLVVHRDLKPANILVTPGGVPKLLDFGIAKLLRPDLPEGRDLTRPNAQPLTREYASPEQLRGEAVTTASDIYSLGVLLYVLLARRHPFENQLSNPVELVRLILGSDPPKPSAATGYSKDQGQAWRNQLRGDLDTIVLRALEKQAALRYRSVAHFSDDLGRYLESKPVVAHKNTALYRTTKFVLRHRLGVIASGLAALGLLATSAAAIRSAAIGREQRISAERRFQEGREFARFVLFQLDDAMRSGITPARKLMIEKALQYLHSLERDSGGDLSLQYDLLEGYAKVGDLQGNLFGPNLGDPTAAEASYRHALELGKSLMASHPSDLRVLRAEARVNTKLGNVLSLSSKFGEALARYSAAKTTLENLVDTDPQESQDLLELWGYIGFAQLQMGNLQEALESYSQYLTLAHRLAASSANRTLPPRRDLAYGFERVGYLKARTGAASEGMNSLRQALSIYRELAASNPGDARAQRDLAVIYSLVGDVAVRSRPAEAVRDFREALRVAEELMSADPENAQYRSDRLVALGRLADALAKAGQLSEARRVIARAERMFEDVQPQNASVYDLITYCSILLTKPSPAKPILAQAKAEESLRYARELTVRTKEHDAFALQFLAQAEDAIGDSESAAATEAKALALLPPNAEPNSRSAMTEELSAFRLRASRVKEHQP